MNIHHIAIWTRDLERLKNFYTTYFDGISNDKYRNNSKEFESYFIRFENGSKLELMQVPGIMERPLDPLIQSVGLSHFAISLDHRETVDKLTNRLMKDGYTVVSEPRVTGDGYYESCILDPDGNRVELVA